MAEAAALAVATPNLFQTVNPATGEKGPAYQGRTVDQALSIAADVHRAQIAWRRTGIRERAPLMKNAAKVIRDNSLRYAKLMTDEMGKPITDGLAELEKCASCCEYFAEMSDKFLKPIPLDMSVGYSGSSEPPKADRGSGCCPQRSIDSCPLWRWQHQDPHQMKEHSYENMQRRCGLEPPP